MAENVYLWLKANGTDIESDSTLGIREKIGSDDVAKAIECLTFTAGVNSAREAGTAMSTGTRTHDTMVITKRMDRSSPLIAKALCNNEAIECIFKFYRPNPTGDGTTQHFYTIELKQARVAFVRKAVQDTLDTATLGRPPTEEIGFAVHTIKWVYVDGGVEHEDSQALRT
jgi:type VI secretion system secreted protein Hcp